MANAHSTKPPSKTADTGQPPSGLDFTRIDEALVRAASRVMSLAGHKHLTLVTAESCTGGLAAAVLSEAPGASTSLYGGIVAYTKACKTAVLDVPAALLQAKGAVCAEVAQAMAEGALRRTGADIAVAVTGVAGPSPDEDGNPVGLMCLTALRRGALPITVERHFGALGRGALRYRAVAEALGLLVEALDGAPSPVRRTPESRPTADSR